VKIVSFDSLANSDLYIDAVYEGGSSGNSGDDPISKLLPCVGNMGGFRVAGRGERKSFVVLYTSGEDKDWPDTMDLGTGRFVYFGDNKTPGHELHDTKPGGNQLLRRIFEHLHGNPPRRDQIPPLFVFAKNPTEISNRSVQFKGLVVPGFPGVPATEDLVAVWKTSGGQRFQNYRAFFTVLDIPIVKREWIDSLTSTTTAISTTGPDAWVDWQTRGRYKPLISEPTTVIRSVDEQTPETETKKGLVLTIFDYFKDRPTHFEAFAARIFQMHDQRVIIDEITRATIDGGRDAIGRYRLGVMDDPVYAEFSLEAKCYAPPMGREQPTTIGVREVSRLISRIRHRQFGVLVTTSVVSRQAYEEVREDGHPIIFLAGKDIADILVACGCNTRELLVDFLEKEFPKPGKKLCQEGGR